LEDTAGHVRPISHPAAQYSKISEPERQPGEKTDLRNIDDAEPELRIYAVPDCPSRDRSGADIVADGVAREARQGGDAVRYLVRSDRAHRKEVVARQRCVGAGDIQHGPGDLPSRHGAYMACDAAEIYVLEYIGEHVD